jgi:hypothetical protein
MKSAKAVLSGYGPDGRPLTARPKRLTKRMRKMFFGKGPGGKPGPGRKSKRNQYRVWRSAAYQKNRLTKGGRDNA